MKILIASGNPGKINEMRAVIKSWGHELITPADLGLSHEVNEDQPTFIQNAIKKATEWMTVSGLPTIADDGGFCIEALGGAPGVKTRRWRDGITEMTDQALVDYTMEQMARIPKEKRQAQLTTVVALVMPEGLTCYSQQSIKGYVTAEPLAPIVPGYPFRSIFWVDMGGISKLYAELTEEEHALINHRIKALRQLKTVLS